MRNGARGTRALPFLILKPILFKGLLAGGLRGSGTGADEIPGLGVLAGEEEGWRNLGLAQGGGLEQG